MEPNASLLFILTISEANKEQVIFLYIKELEEKAPSEFHWYPQKGAEGKSEFIWEEKKLKQWLAIGTDEQIIDIFQTLIHEKSKKIDFGEKELLFEIEYNEFEIINEDNLEKIDEVPSFKEYLKYEFKDLRTDISFLVNQKENCSCIDGSLFNEIIKPIYPSGLFFNNFLSEHIDKRVLGINEKRGIYLYMRGERNIHEGHDPQKLYGFLQENENFKNSIKIEIYELDKDEKIGETFVDRGTGVWEVNLNKPVGKGKLIIKKKDSEDRLYGHKFYLIKEININMNVVNNSIKDMYNRIINITDNNKLEKPIESTISWNKSNGSTSVLAELELSDKYEKVLLSLGEVITICDPFLLGDIDGEYGNLKYFRDKFIHIKRIIKKIFESIIIKVKLIYCRKKDNKYENNSKLELIENCKIIFQIIRGDSNIEGDKLKYSKDQFIFINAFIIAIIKGTIKEVKLICNWNKVKKFGNNNKSKMIENYKKLFHNINHELKKVNKTLEVEIYFCKTPFHDRYWVGINNGLDVVYHVSNSINGIFKNREVSFIPENGNENYKQRMSIIRKINNSDREVILNGSNKLF